MRTRTCLYHRDSIHISIDYRRNHLFPSENKVFWARRLRPMEKWMEQRAWFGDIGVQMSRRGCSPSEGGASSIKIRAICHAKSHPGWDGFLHGRAVRRSRQSISFSVAIPPACCRSGRLCPPASDAKTDIHIGAYACIGPAKQNALTETYGKLAASLDKV